MDREHINGTRLSLGPCSVSWLSKEAIWLHLFTVEVEYIDAWCGREQMLWMKQTIKDFGLLWKGSMYCDSMSTISLSKKPVQHSKDKDIELRHHFIGTTWKKWDVSTEFFGTKDKPDNKDYLFKLKEIGYWIL